MKRILFALAVVVMPLGGCATDGLLKPSTQLTVAKAEYGFEATYNVAGNAYLTAVANGQLTGPDKDRAKALLGQAYSLLLVARKAQAAGDATSVDAQSAAIAALVVGIMQIVKGTH